MSINIGNNNKIINSNFTENANTINKEKETKEGFWKSVLVNITSELLWKIICIIVSGGLIAFGIYIFVN